MSWTPDTTMKVLGRGSEATVYLDPESGRAVKYFDRAPIRVARSKAESEFARLNHAFELSKQSHVVRVPAPGTLTQLLPAFSMEKVHGRSLLDELACGHISGEETRRMARNVAEGVRLFRDILADCTLDHIHPDENGNVTFFDFGNGSEDVDGRHPGDLKAVFENIAGSTLYECSRVGRYRGLAELDKIARFLAALVRELDLSWTDRLEKRIWQSFAERALEGSLPRYLWYRLAGGFNSRRIFSMIRAELPSLAPPTIDTLFSFVWDFPVGDEPLTNGVHKVVDGLMQHAAATGVKPVVLTLGEDQQIIDRGDYTIEVYPKHRKTVRSALIDRIDKEGRTGVTILNGTFNHWNSRLAFALHRKGLPFAVNPHTIMDAGFFGVSRFKKWVYWTLVDRPLLNRAMAIVSFSADAESDLKRRGVHAPVIESWNGICDPVVPQEDVFTTEGPVRFHFFGRVATQTKGLDLLLDAAADVASSHTIEVTIQGPGTDDLPALKQRVNELGLDSIIRFEAPASTPNPIKIMGRHDVCILPSRYEGFPTALVEAMMAARPIVTTRVGSLAPVLEREGIAIVVDTSSEAIAQGMRDVIQNRSEWPEVGLAGRAWALRHLEWSPIVEQLMEDLTTVHQNQA